MQSRTRQVAKHNTKIDCWVSAAAEVLKVTHFLPEHPGGEFAILTFAGEDARGACFQQWVQLSETSRRIQKSRVRFVRTWITL